MKIFIASLKNELKKLLVRKKYLVFLIIEVLISVLNVGVGTLVTKASDGMVTSAALIGNMSMGMLSFILQIYIPLIIFMGCCDVFAAEFHDGTMRATFMRPVTRFKQYFSKITALLLLALVYLVTLLVVSTIIQIVISGNASGTLSIFVSYIIDIIPLIVLILFAAMINQFTNSPSLSIIITIIIYIALNFMGIVLPATSGMLFIGYLQWHNIWIGEMIPFSAMLAKIGILLGSGLVFASIGYYIFERREL